MTNREIILNAGKRIAAIASGRAFKEKGESNDEAPSPDLVEPRHKSIGIKDDVQEHEGERLNPGGQDGGSSGASRNKPKDPSNSA